MYLDYLNEKLDDIEKILDRKSWISSWQIFLQSIKSVGMRSYDQDPLHTFDSLRMGSALRLLTKNKKLIEVNYAVSELSQLRNLKEPSSTYPISPNVQFPELKYPNASSISGDFANTVNMKTSPYLKILNEAYDISEEEEIPLQHSSQIQLENRLIKNSNSIKLSENSLKSTYSVYSTFEIGNYNYQIGRNIAGRSLQLEIEPILNDLYKTVKFRIKSIPVVLPENPAILFHPEVIGKLISFYYSQLEDYDNNSIKDVNLGWDENFALYDDPTRIKGFYSTLFDDEGFVTKPKQLVADGIIQSSLLDLKSSSWRTGGNGYRVDWFESNLRSYNYQVKPSISNLVLTGGTGKGIYFSERPGDLLLIRNGFGYPITGSINGEFIFHVHEADLYHNGTKESPLVNFTITGNLNNLLHFGQLSSDEIESIDPNIPGSMYSGWLIVPPSIVTLRS